jgi:hypothetical protein
MWPMDEDATAQRQLLVRYEHALCQIIRIGRQTKGPISGTARVMATLAAEAVSSRAMLSWRADSETASPDTLGP